MERTQRTEAALRLAARGFAVFPVRPNGKKPFIKGWQIHATKDPDKIRAVWGDPKHPDFNIGISTGALLNGRHFFVLDVDTKDDKRGDKSLRTLEAIYNELPATLTHATPSGGQHRVFFADAPVPCSVSKIASGLDIRGAGGLIVGPGSSVDSGVYEILHDREVAAAPSWLVDLAESAATPRPASKAPLDAVLDLPQNVDRAIDYLANGAEEAIEGSGGDNATIRVINHLGDLAISQDVALDLLLEHWNDSKAVPPWDVDDLRRKVASAYKSRQNAIGVKSAEAEFPAEEVKQAAPPDGWNEPADLWGEAPRLPALPSNSLPKILHRFAEDKAARLGVDAGTVAIAALTAYGSLVPAGNRLNLRQQSDEWQVRPILWAAIIGAPGSNKSAVFNVALRGAKAVEAEWRKEYAKAKRVNEFASAAGRDKALEEAAQPAAVQDPKFRQKITNDATTEALGEVLASNPAGLLGAYEELSGLFGGMDAYKPRGGKDRPFWLEAKEGGPRTINRRGSGVTFVPACAISVLGTIQPDKLRAASKGLVDDGFLQRFMLVHIRRLSDGLDLPSDGDLDRLMGDIALALADAPAEAAYRLSPEASQELQAVIEFKNRELSRPDNPPALLQWLDKLPNEFGRLVLVCHHLEWASGIGRAIAEGPDTVAPAGTAQQVRRLIVEFLYPHARAIYCDLLLGDRQDNHGRWIAGYILARRLETISERDIYRSYPALKSAERHSEIPIVMRSLELNDWVRPAKFNSKGNVTAWRINPAVHDGRFAEIARSEAERRETAREGIKQAGEARRAGN